jgi:hypothetical protein
MTEEEWLKNKLSEYKVDPQTCLEDTLDGIIQVIEQFLLSGGKVSRSILESCAKNEARFLKVIRVREGESIKCSLEN